ncbi:hypothetical protein PR048_033720 [Dryococelus australis]|uniref:Uncharacterized protein n=1 Tax=Dryococelus australis TaxID=614101 RepID=A0ABQ9G140_9NEOP|nr:hypothetical protein PR048_033720 [Dryococelus australis]
MAAAARQPGAPDHSKAFYSVPYSPHFTLIGSQDHGHRRVSRPVSSRPCIPALLHTHRASPSSALKSRPNPSTHPLTRTVLDAASGRALCLEEMAHLMCITVGIINLSTILTSTAAVLRSFSLPIKANRGSIPVGVASGLSQVVIVPDDAAGRRVSSGISRFARSCIPAAPYSPRFIGS